MNQSGSAPLIGTFRALVDAGDASFSVVVEIKEPVVDAKRIEQLIEGLVGDSLRSLVRRPSEGVFVNQIDPLSPRERVPNPLQMPIENDAWWPGARIVSVTAI